VAFARLHEQCLREQQRMASEQELRQRNTSHRQGEHSAESTEPLFCSWTKRGFSFVRDGDVVDGPLDDFHEHALALARSTGASRNEYPQLWILKPQQSFNQMGISMVYLEAHDLQSVATARAWLREVLPLDGSWTLQEYVRHPLLYRGRKFDLRVWAAITSVDPLRIYMLDHAFPKISTVHYSSEGADVGRHCLSSPRCACMHVRMPMGEGCVKDDLVHPYPPHTATGIFKRGLHFGPLFVGRGSSAADEWDVWERVILPQMAKILITTVLLAREGEPLTLHKILQQADPQVHYRRVLLLSPDFIVDEAGTVIVEEINTNGFLVGDDELYSAQKDTIDLMRVVGADGWPRRPLYAEQAAKLVDAYIASREYDEHDIQVLKPMLKELIHEEVAAHPTAWKRIYPPPLSPDGHAQPDPAQQGKGYATDLDDATSDFLAFRARSPQSQSILDMRMIDEKARALRAQSRS